jgi:hypothetical protein
MLLFFTVSAGYTQDYINYYNVINKAEYYIHINKYDSALILFDKASKIENLQAKEYYLQAFCLTKKEKFNEQKVKRLIIKSARKNGIPTVWMKKQALDMKLNHSFISRIKKQEKKRQKQLKVIRDTVNYFLSEDRKYRTILVDSISVFFESDSKEHLEYSHFIEIQDSINQNQFLEYINREGYPGIYKSGTDIIATVLLHINCHFFIRYKELLMKELRKGNIQPFYFASMVDRINCHCYGESFFSAYKMGNSIGKCLNLNQEEIVNNRKKIGLSTYFYGPRVFNRVIRTPLINEL